MDIVFSFTLEVTPVKRDDGFISMCDEEEAEFFGVYYRPHDTEEKLATWVRDFNTMEEAKAFIEGVKFIFEVKNG